MSFVEKVNPAETDWKARYESSKLCCDVAHHCNMTSIIMGVPSFFGESLLIIEKSDKMIAIRDQLKPAGLVDLAASLAQEISNSVSIRLVNGVFGCSASDNSSKGLTEKIEDLVRLSAKTHTQMLGKEKEIAGMILSELRLGTQQATNLLADHATAKIAQQTSKAK
jgi:hypothetical protein